MSVFDIHFTIASGDSFYPVFRGLEDFLVRITKEDGTVLSGYVEARDDEVVLDDSFGVSTRHWGEIVSYDDIKKVEVL